MNALRQWQLRELPVLREAAFARPVTDDLTVVAYTFPAEGGEDAFAFLECAILQTWRVLGKLPVSLVAGRPFKAAVDFASRHGCVDLQIEGTLVPGRIETMSADCCGRLCGRFATAYCLVVQDDGFPLRPGIGDFLGKWDFVGAPYVRISPLRNIVSRICGLNESNGGFSLRSKRICEAAAEWWKRKYSALHPSRATVEDIYYTRTLPLRHSSFRFKYKIAPNTEAIKFSYDAIVRQPVAEPPFGFHRAESFAFLSERGAGAV